MEYFLVFRTDDLFIYSQTEEEHLKHVQQIFEKFCKVGIILKMSKCKYFKIEIQYVGHLISRKGISSMKVKGESYN